MDLDCASPSIKYTKQILDLIEKEIVEVRGNISSVEVKLRQMQDRQKDLYEERKNMLKELRKIESELMTESVPNPYTDVDLQTRVLEKYGL